VAGFAPPLVLERVPVTTPLLSILIDMIPPIGILLLIIVNCPDQLPFMDPWYGNELLEPQAERGINRRITDIPRKIKFTSVFPDFIC
jgi:hypothetical protein